MKLRSIFATLIIVTTLFFPSTSQAAIPSEEMNIGGISLYSSTDYVKSIYGEPNSSKSIKGPYDTEYTYGDSLNIYFTDNKVVLIESNAHNGLTTPAGIGVGSSEKEIYKLYGRPDSSYTGLMFYSDKNRRYCTLRITTSKGKVTKLEVFEEI